MTITLSICSPWLISTNPGQLYLFCLNILMKIFINSALTTKIMNCQTRFFQHRKHPKFDEQCMQLSKVRVRDKKFMSLVRDNLSPGSHFQSNIQLQFRPWSDRDSDNYFISISRTLMFTYIKPSFVLWGNWEKISDKKKYFKNTYNKPISKGGEWDTDSRIVMMIKRKNKSNEGL